MATTIAEEVLGVLRCDPPAYPVNDPFQVEHVRQQDLRCRAGALHAVRVEVPRRAK